MNARPWPLALYILPFSYYENLLIAQFPEGRKLSQACFCRKDRRDAIKLESIPARLLLPSGTVASFYCKIFDCVIFIWLQVFFLEIGSTVATVATCDHMETTGFNNVKKCMDYACEDCMNKVMTEYSDVKPGRPMQQLYE